jgi:hypothetical protein
VFAYEGWRVHAVHKNDVLSLVRSTHDFLANAQLLIIKLATDHCHTSQLGEPADSEVYTCTDRVQVWNGMCDGSMHAHA